MKAVSTEQLARRAKCRIGFLLIACCVSLACSIPNLEPQSCIDARTSVREFYSFHFGNGLGFGDEDLDKRQHYLTPELYDSLRVPPRDGPPGIDPFTRTDHDPPKAFRVGECEEVDPQSAVFEVLLFWKDDVRSEERKITVAVAKRNEHWLIDRVSAVATY